MKVTMECEQFLVLDDLLPEDQFVALWRHFQTLAFQTINPGARLSPWLPTDGRPLTTKTVVAWVDPSAALPAARQSCYPTHTPLDFFLEYLLSDVPRLQRWVGTAIAEWVALSTAGWIYPAGSALSWHTDSVVYTGAYAFYLHPRWDAHWGGELVVAHPSARHQRGPMADLTSKQPALEGMGRFDRSPLDARVAEVGIGHHILPKPNRLVVIAGGHPHCIARVDNNAGSNLRASLSGFFLHPQALAELGRASTPPG